MSADERVDDLLDECEDLLAENPQADVLALVDTCGGTLDDESLKRFRKKASALASMNERLDALQDTESLPGDTSRPISSRHGIANLQPGYEPIEGYKLVERLVAGGFGEVYKATDAQGFSVAIKFV